MHNRATKVRDAYIVHTDKDAPIYLEPTEYVETQHIDDSDYESPVLDKIRSTMQ